MERVPGRRIQKTFQSPFARMVEGTSRKRRLPAIGGQADDPPAALGAQMRQCRAYKLDRAEEICRELMGDLLVAEFFRRVEEPVARVADDHVDSAKLREGFVHHAAFSRLPVGPKG